MKIASPPCTFKFYNKDNPTGSDDANYYVSAFSVSNTQYVISDVVSGSLCVDSITVSVDLSVMTPLSVVFEGSASFVFPARHWALTLDGHATLAELDKVEDTVTLIGMVAAVPTPMAFAITAEIVASAQTVYDDWSQT